MQCLVSVQEPNSEVRAELPPVSQVGAVSGWPSWPRGCQELRGYTCQQKWSSLSHVSLQRPRGAVVPIIFAVGRKDTTKLGFLFVWAVPHGSGVLLGSPTAQGTSYCCKLPLLWERCTSNTTIFGVLHFVAMHLPQWMQYLDVYKDQVVASGISIPEPVWSLYHWWRLAEEHCCLFLGGERSSRGPHNALPAVAAQVSPPTSPRVPSAECSQSLEQGCGSGSTGVSCVTGISSGTGTKGLTGTILLGHGVSVWGGWKYRVVLPPGSCSWGMRSSLEQIWTHRSWGALGPQNKGSHKEPEPQLLHRAMCSRCSLKRVPWWWSLLGFVQMTVTAHPLGVPGTGKAAWAPQLPRDEELGVWGWHSVLPAFTAPSAWQSSAWNGLVLTPLFQGHAECSLIALL